MSRTDRPYASRLRSEQAAETRRKIAAAARRLFVRNGFAGTTIEQIAESAGVAAPTVYATYGSKRAILLALFEEAFAKEGLQADLAADADPRRQLRLIVEFDVRLFTESADLMEALRGAGRADRALDRIRIEGETRRRSGLAAVVRSWHDRGALREGLSEEEAVDVMWAMSSDLLYSLFVRGNRWPAERYLDWLAATLQAMILATPPA